MTSASGFVGSSSGFATSVAISSRKASFHQAVRDSRNRRVRGLWRHGEVYYTRIKVVAEDGRQVDRRVRLRATTLGDARIEQNGKKAPWSRSSVPLGFASGVQDEGAKGKSLTAIDQRRPRSWSRYSIKGSP
jgi:hypothetical protein